MKIERIVLVIIAVWLAALTIFVVPREIRQKKVLTIICTEMVRMHGGDEPRPELDPNPD